MDRVPDQRHGPLATTPGPGRIPLYRYHKSGTINSEALFPAGADIRTMESTPLGYAYKQMQPSVAGRPRGYAVNFGFVLHVENESGTIVRSSESPGEIVQGSSLDTVGIPFNAYEGSMIDMNDVRMWASWLTVD